MNFPIIISSVNELVRVYPERIVYISSDGNYSMMVLHDKTEHLFSFNLSHFQQILEKQMKAEASVFIRIGKSLIINRTYIYKIHIGKRRTNPEYVHAYRFQRGVTAIEEFSGT